MPESQSNLIFQRLPRTFSRRGLKALARRIQAHTAPESSFTCLIARDDELERLNREFLDRDYPADVLSFPSPGPGGFLGEIAISVDRAAEQAQQYGHPPEDEIGILLLHGILHLLGMDHERDRGRMARTERRHRKELGLPDSLIERVRR